MDVEMIMENFPIHTSTARTYLQVVIIVYRRIVLSWQLMKLRRHNKSAKGLSNANPARGHNEVPRSTGRHGCSSRVYTELAVVTVIPDALVVSYHRRRS